MAKTLISDRQKFFSEFYLYLLDIVPSYHPMQFKGKLMNQTRENYKKKTNFRPYFGSTFVPQKFFSWVLRLLVVRHCSKLSSFAIPRQTNEPNLRK